MTEDLVKNQTNRSLKVSQVDSDECVRNKSEKSHRTSDRRGEECH
jgi:hypothetical protein